jgi:uncharacterized protein
MIHPLLLKYYPEDTALRRILLHHSQQVVERALFIAERHPELQLNVVQQQPAAAPVVPVG